MAITHCPQHPAVKLRRESASFVGMPNAGFCSACREHYHWFTGEPMSRYMNPVRYKVASLVSRFVLGMSRGHCQTYKKEVGWHSAHNQSKSCGRLFFAWGLSKIVSRSTMDK